MNVSRRTPLTLLAFIATGLAVLLAYRPAEAGMVASRRPAEMKGDACCCPRPLQAQGGCCCCKPAPPAIDRAEDTDTARVATVGQVSGSRLPVESGLPGRSCQCRASDPVAPPAPREERGGESREDFTAATATQRLLDGHPAPAFPGRHNARAPSCPDTPLYLRIARLLI